MVPLAPISPGSVSVPVVFVACKGAIGLVIGNAPVVGCSSFDVVSGFVRFGATPAEAGGETCLGADSEPFIGSRPLDLKPERGRVGGRGVSGKMGTSGTLPGSRVSTGARLLDDRNAAKPSAVRSPVDLLLL